MRITGGTARGIQLTAPKGSGTRPATDQLREAVFSSLGARIEGARIADLFAGTSAYGLEAMSRGASGGIFVESQASVIKCLRKNLSAVAKSCDLNSLSDWRVLSQKVETLTNGMGPFEIVFMDPPYDMIEARIPEIFVRNVSGLVASGGILCFEMPGNIELDLPGWKAARRLGKAGKDKPTAVFYEREE